MKCILCFSEAFATCGFLSCVDLIRTWQQEYGFDIANELQGCEQIALRSCEACGLLFYDPPIEGSAELYKQLQKFDWYYMPRKWEHDSALQDIRPTGRVLEVGCGIGDFIARVTLELNAEALGLELNAAAVARGRAMGRSVYDRPVQDVALEEPGSFDAVCAFQVLEHTSRPAQFLSACVALLKPGGRLCLGVPNEDGFLRKDPHNFLNQPPHHVTRWSRRPLRWLTQEYPLALRRIACEPLAPYHIEYYISVQLRSTFGEGSMPDAALRVLRRGLALVLGRLRLSRLIRGHTIYASYEKTSDVVPS